VRSIEKKNNAQRLENSYTIAKDQREGREKNQHDGDLQQQQDLNSNTKSSPSKSTKFSKEIKDEEIVGMKAFEKLLTSYDKEEHNSQIDENNYNLRSQRRLEGQLISTDPFTSLVYAESGDKLRETGLRKVIPWLNENPSKHEDYFVVISDPRNKSLELRDLMKNFSYKLPKDILKRTIFINSDTPAESRKWLKKNNVQKLEIYSDENRDWMQEYSALGEERWSMCMFVLADKAIQKLDFELNVYTALNTVTNAVRDFK